MGEDDGEFYVLSAVLLTPGQFPSVLGDDYPDACDTLGLEPWADGYGLLFGQDAAGARWTVVSDDAALVGCAIAAWDCGMPYDLTPPERTVVDSFPGWPLPLAVSAPGLPEPHDPAATDDDHPLLSPPDPEGWGPAQRRLGADEISKQWDQWRSQVPDSVNRNDDGRAPSEHVAKVLAEAREYTRTPPPAGRVRSAPAADGARLVRADGPGWSLAARTDDIALLLLDDQPREVLPIGRGPELPALLHALDRMARASG
ncbi:membrane protein [Streptacidiphilus albus]|uniref:membrane protein n=1 Tax=Streptacidiphilus albus TaxID=105425 RepID=UPI00054B50A2|nr:membrane protein [Streptacidiphilus albus]